MSLKLSKRYFIYTAVVILLVFLHFTKILIPVESGVARLLSPILHGFYSVGTNLRGYYNQQTDKRDLSEENRKLQTEYNELLIENSKLKYVEDENRILRQALDFLSASKDKYILASIVARTGEIGSLQSIIIDRGSDDGLYNGLGVTDNHGVLIGKLAEVKKEISEVWLTTNPKCKIAATLQNMNRTSGITNGDLGLTIKMEYIPQNELVKIGDTVITSNIDPNLASGYLIGKVIQVNQEDNEIWQSAVIEPLTDMNTLSIVSVIIPEKK